MTARALESEVDCPLLALEGFCKSVEAGALLGATPSEEEGVSWWEKRTWEQLPALVGGISHGVVVTFCYRQRVGLGVVNHGMIHFLSPIGELRKKMPQLAKILLRLEVVLAFVIVKPPGLVVGKEVGSVGAVVVSSPELETVYRIVVGETGLRVIKSPEMDVPGFTRFLYQPRLC